jgi:hypothetical protein
VRVRQTPQTNTPNEFNRIVTADASDRVRQLSSILRDKGLITAAEAASLYVSSAPSTFLHRRRNMLRLRRAWPRVSHTSRVATRPGSSRLHVLIEANL